MVVSTGGVPADWEPEIPYHPFCTLFQLVCDVVRVHEPGRTRSNNMHALVQQGNNDRYRENRPRQSNNAALVGGRNTNPTQNTLNRDPFRCFRCDSAQHLVRNCPEPLPRCSHCFQDGHKREQCFQLHGRPQNQIRGNDRNFNPGNARNRQGFGAQGNRGPNRVQPQYRGNMRAMEGRIDQEDRASTIYSKEHQE